MTYVTVTGAAHAVKEVSRAFVTAAGTASTVILDQFSQPHMRHKIEKDLRGSYDGCTNGGTFSTRGGCKSWCKRCSCAGKSTR